MRLCLLVVLCLAWLPSTDASARSSATIDRAIAALSRGEIAGRVRAANRLGRCGRRPECAKAVRALERALFAPHPALRRAAVNALTSLDARGSGGAVVRLLTVERDVTVLPAALIALGKLQVHGAQHVLTAYAAHAHPAVRAAALTAAGDLGGPVNRRLLLNSLQMAGAEDGDWLVRSSAILALAKVGRAADLDLVQRVYREGGGAGSWLARSAVARVLAALHPRPRAALERMLQDPDMRVAVTAAAGLAKAGLEDVLLMHLRSSQTRVRAAAVGGVRQARLRRALPRLRHMARWDRSRAVRWAAAVALFALEDPAGDELMLEALKSREVAIWVEALAHLARRTGAAHARDVRAWRAELRRWRVR